MNKKLGIGAAFLFFIFGVFWYFWTKSVNDPVSSVSSGTMQNSSVSESGNAYTNSTVPSAAATTRSS